MVEKDEVKALRTQQQRKFTLETMMKIEEEEQAIMQRIKDEEFTRAIKELEDCKEKQKEAEGEEDD